MSKEQKSKPTPFWSRGDKTIWDFISIFSLPVIVAIIPLVYQHKNTEAESSRNQIQHQEELVDGYIKYVQELILNNVYAGGKDPKVELVDIEFLLKSKTTTTILALKDNETQRGLLLSFLREKNIGFMSRSTDYRDNLLKVMVEKLYCPKDFDHFTEDNKQKQQEKHNEELKKLKKKYVQKILPQVREQMIQPAPNLEELTGKKLDLRIGLLNILCGIDLNNTTLSNNELALSVLGDVDFTDAELIKTNFTSSKMNGAKFGKADLTEASFLGAELRKAIFQGATLKKANFTKASLRGADFSIKKYKKYKDSQEREKEKITDLTEANLTEANLMEANLVQANLTRTSLMGANLMGANLMGANLMGANLMGVKLYPFYDPHQERLKKVDFTNANLTKVQGITEINLKDSILCNTTMFDGKTKKNRDCSQKSEQ